MRLEPEWKLARAEYYVARARYWATRPPLARPVVWVPIVLASLLALLLALLSQAEGDWAFKLGGAVLGAVGR